MHGKRAEMFETKPVSFRIGQVRIELDMIAGSYQDRQIQIDGVWERHLSIFFSVHLQARENQVFFDVGANVGYYSMLAARCGSRVVAFEPNEAVRQVLSGNVAAHAPGSVTIDPRIVGTGAERLRLVAPADFDEGSYASSAGAGDRADPSVSIDNFVEETGVAPTVIKCDAEGRDLDVLVGARRTLAEAMPTVVFEYQPAKIAALSSTRPAEAFEMLGQAGYTPYLFRGHSGVAAERVDFPILQRIYDLGVADNSAGHWDVLLWPRRFTPLTRQFEMPG